MRLKRIEAGEQGWQGTAWALERLYPHRFARPEVMNQIAVVANAQNTRGGELIIDKEMLERISERRKEVMKQLKDDVREEMQTGGAGE